MVTWGSASLHNGPRDRYLGWDERARQANLHLVVNNTRFLILPAGLRDNDGMSFQAGLDVRFRPQHLNNIPDRA